MGIYLINTRRLFFVLATINKGLQSIVCCGLNIKEGGHSIFLTDDSDRPSPEVVQQFLEVNLPKLGDYLNHSFYTLHCKKDIRQTWNRFGKTTRMIRGLKSEPCNERLLELSMFTLEKIESSSSYPTNTALRCRLEDMPTFCCLQLIPSPPWRYLKMPIKENVCSSELKCGIFDAL